MVLAAVNALRKRRSRATFSCFGFHVGCRTRSARIIFTFTSAGAVVARLYYERDASTLS